MTSVERLLEFDKQVLDLLSAPLRSLKERLARHELDSPRLQPDRLIVTLEGIRDNESLRPYYGTMYNQCLVLTVSYFAAAVRELFVDEVAHVIRSQSNDSVLTEEIKLPVRELIEGEPSLPKLIAENLADERQVSWQDMQSIDRAFKKYFTRVPPRDTIVNNIIVAQGCRHVIVHSGGQVTKRLIKQTQEAAPRSFNPDLTVGESIQITPQQVLSVGIDMLAFLERMATAIHDPFV